MPPLPPTIEGCHSLIKELYNIILVLQDKVEVLEGRVNQTSENAHRPPSSDGLTKLPTVKRHKGGKVGGQKGHTGKIVKNWAKNRKNTEGGVNPNFTKFLM